MSPADGLAAIVRQAGRARGVGTAGTVVGCGLLGAGLGGMVSAPLPGALLGGLLGGGVAWRHSRREPLTPELVARHLDRTIPALEDSTGLLLVELSSLSTVARLQRERVESRWEASVAGLRLPRRRLWRTLSRSLLLGVIGIGLLALPHSAAREILPAVLTGGAVDAQATVRGLSLRVQPPRYTGVAEHTESGDELLAEEGAGLVWLARVSGPVRQVQLAFSSGDSLTLTHQKGTEWSANGIAMTAALVRLVLTDTLGGKIIDQDRRLAVRPDRPPVVTLVQPTGRTEFPRGTIPTVEVDALAADDYGIDSTFLSLTIATGRGEQVTFQRRMLPFATRERRPDGGLRLRARLDLGVLGLGPGDELYFHVEATDRKVPVPGRGRSETAFLVLPDTASAPDADFAGITLTAEPEYFRSQRQIIIDTRRLIVDGPTLPRTTFRDRSNEIGIDQGLLRLRYGQFLGEEFEEEEGTAAGMTDVRLPGAPPTNQQPDLREEFTHKHDDAENATLLGASVKTRLKAAVSAMWQAELHLRTADPVGAIPFEERALTLLKSVQQESRAYVQRVGFEPPPIEIDRLRLSGKQDEIRNRAVARRILPHDSLAVLRRALAAATGESDVPEIHAAGEEVAALAVNDPRLLPALHAFRRLGDSLAVHRPCPACRAEIARRLYPLLPTPEPSQGTRPPALSALSERYLQRLTAERP